ncbi:MAG TPA: hypothetical protein PK079_05525 [Leptospiraceae bacterium]|nr:hypothetical protein [Leptospiraceae bacterium]HMZ62600.1 hypothetical protein [Leptospiraceae bacterium]HNA07973.1 hypothetical protein [Leptospiraceae bacterium]HNB99049.1 hypothetical protein [Leptospiraceae bacterium]HNC57450.1 hypothetical protein [Leptospiraceae bacterium]
MFLCIPTSTALVTLLTAVIPTFRTQEGWKRYSEIECKDDYFVIMYEGWERFEQSGSTFFLMSILNYPFDYDISQNEKFANFQKDFLRNNKIQTDSRGSEY